MKTSKRGQVDVQFHWVFILIIGAIILSFFVGLSVWYKDNQEQKITADIVTSLDSVLDTAKQSPKTARTTTIPDITLSFSCSADDCNDYGCVSDFSGGGISQPTETEVLFTLSDLSGSELISWALEWQLPYKITNFLYLTTDRVRYVFVYDEDHKELATAVMSLLSENDYVTKETIKIEQASDFTLTDKNDDYVRIVAFLNEDTLSESSISAVLGENSASDITWDILYIEGTEDSGTIHFSDGDASYLGLPLLLGAVFSADKDFYRCNVHKAALQGKIVSSVYFERTLALSDVFSTSSDKNYCSYYYGDDVQTAIENIKEGVADILDTPNTLSDPIQLLIDNNKYAVIKNCPRVY